MHKDFTVTDGTPITPLMRELSSYIAGAMARKLPEDVAERAGLHLVDTFAAMTSGSRLLPGKRAIAFVKQLGGVREAGVIGSRVVTSALHAALANGMSAHGDETDDTHPASRAHPGSSVIPAVLAIAERERLPGALALRALVLGYDICARTLLSLAPVAGERAHYYNGAFGQLFGAAAAAGALLKLGVKKTRYLLSYAAEQASGLETRKRDFQHIEKAYAVGGMPAHNGVLAALMVKAGFTGVEDVYAESPGFFSTFSPHSDREALVRDLGRNYEIMRSGIKCWPAGGPIQAPLHVLHHLIREHSIAASQVLKVFVRVPEAELQSVNNRAMPNISLQHLLAVTLLDGTLTFDAAHDYSRLKDSAVVRIRKRIEVLADPSMTRAVRGWRCAMQITLKDRRVLSHETMAAKGSYENPLTRRELEEKALGLMAPAMGTRRAQALVSALFNISALEDVRMLRRHYRV